MAMHSSDMRENFGAYEAESRLGKRIRELEDVVDALRLKLNTCTTALRIIHTHETWMAGGLMKGCYVCRETTEKALAAVGLPVGPL